MKKLLVDRKKIAILMLASFLFSSCENWLDIAPEKDLIKDNFWKKTEDANSALAAVYASLRDVSDWKILSGANCVQILLQVCPAIMPQLPEVTSIRKMMP